MALGPIFDKLAHSTKLRLADSKRPNVNQIAINAFAPTKQSSTNWHKKNINYLYFYHSLVLGHWLLYRSHHITKK